jgi:hypothetical protein
MSSWQLIFAQSKVNNGRYDGDHLLGQNWDWPRETWFQMRLRDLRKGNRKSSEESTQQKVAVA